MAKCMQAKCESDLRRWAGNEEKKKRTPSKYTQNVYQGMDKLKDFKKDKILTGTEAFNYTLLGMFIEVNTGRLVHPLGSKMSIPEMARLVSEDESNFRKSFKKYNDHGLIIEKVVDERKVYFANPSFMFNGTNRNKIMKDLEDRDYDDLLANLSPFN